MPFFDDSGVKTEEHSGPVWGAFALLFDQLERMVLVNLAWSATLIPGMVGLSLGTLDLWARVLLVLLSVVLVIPATGALYELIGRASQGELISLEMARDSLKEKARTSINVLLPLFSTFFWLGLAAWAAGGAGIVLLDTLARLLILIFATVSVYWGPIFAFRAGLPFWGVLRESLRLAFRAPLFTLLTSIAVLLTWALGILSIGGIFLVAPVLSALLQTKLYLQTAHSH